MSYYTLWMLHVPSHQWVIILISALPPLKACLGCIFMVLGTSLNFLLTHAFYSVLFFYSSPALNFLPQLPVPFSVDFSLSSNILIHSGLGYLPYLCVEHFLNTSFDFGLGSLSMDI
ncbi:uncharacterized protein BJ212DRAFT_1485979 [Suillus subaureus]|uniref:Uncharacterized protein n=1 Tax=Suillus subaureus TaxID=48587 RepID=A0A9P7DYF4_9AGAM|nr:uncharacterized protein BJ212DRAFT_1485979 [Suillus subaureus]KAG1806218.1 hypothetical protein BJ212DRAFT_1485979 [Suillus subaureus]